MILQKSHAAAILLSMCVVELYGQYAWKHDFVGNGYVSASQVEVDFKDDIYVGGYFENGVTILNNSLNGNGSFLLKLDKNGKFIRLKPLLSTASGYCIIDHVKV